MTIIISHHILLFCTVNIDFIDNDQILIWLGAKHYSQGIFYEPRFYGQAYSTMMEGLFAVPFMWLKLPVYYAVPLATHIIFLFPFLFPAFYLFKKKLFDKAILVLTILLCMPLGFDVMASIPRGFVTGLFFTSFFVINLLNPYNYKYILLNTVFACIGVLVNPNSVLVSAPFLFYLFLLNYKDKRYYVYSIMGLVCALPFEFLLNHYYRIHPESIIFDFSNKFDPHYFIDAVSHLDDRFAHIGFFIEESCVITLIVFFAIGLYFFKKNKKWFFSFILFISIILISFLGEKTADGVVWPHFSYSRMYLAIPVFFSLCIVLCSFSINKIKYVIVGIVIAFTIYKEINYKSRLKYYAQEKLWSHVNLVSLPEVFKYTESFKTYCKRYNSKAIIIIGWTWRDDVINYGGPALDDNYPKTFKPHFERRRWRIEEEKNTVYHDFIIYSRYRDLDKTIKEKYKDVSIQRIDDWGAFYVYNNDKTTVEFLKYIEAETLGF